MRPADIDSAAQTVTLPDPADLPALASAAPAEALDAAHRWLESSTDARSTARAHQAAGIVRRDRGEMVIALRHLDAALEAALRGIDRRATADIRATRGGTLAMSGRVSEGLAELDLALRDTTGGDRAGVLQRRAWIVAETGDKEAALPILTRALSIARRADAQLWEARVLNLRCLVLIGLGLAQRAAADARKAATLYDDLGQTWMSAQARHNLAQCATLRGDLVTSLRAYDDVAERYRALDVDEPMLVVDRIGALLAAGLAADAAIIGQEYLAADRSSRSGPALGSLLVAMATAELAAGRADTAATFARDARRAFGAASRPAWAGRAALLAAQARQIKGDRSARLLRDATKLTSDETLFAADRLAARLLTARLAVARGETATARAGFTELGRRVRGPALDRATAWLARALLAQLDGDDVRVRRACARGLDAVDEHRAVFGAVEVRAAASVHGAEFAELGTQALLRRGSARQLLDWVERSRASALADPAPVTATDSELARRLALAREAAVSAAESVQATRTAERAVAALRMTSANRASATARDDGARLESLGDRVLVELLVADGIVHTLVGRSGRVRRLTHHAPLADVRCEADFLRFALRRAGAGIGVTSRERLLAAGRRLQEVLFGVGFSVGDQPLVVVPPAGLHDLPWAALPAFGSSEIVVAPSLTLWERAHAARRRSRKGTVLAAGPGLATGGAELDQIAALDASATLVGAGTATAENLLTAMDGARLVHLAAHGTLRADNPMFSALQVDGGPLFVHDLERLRRAPREVVLASCNSGLGSDVGADQLLGLATALLRAGSAAVLTSTVAVSDEACVPFAVEVHRALAAGATLPAAAKLARAHAADDPDPLAAATALAFTVWGS